MHDGMLDAETAHDAAARWSIGIDFGTAFSKAAATRLTHESGAALREVRPLRLGEATGWRQPFLTPSTLFLDGGRLYFGPWAIKRLSETDPEKRELVRSFKTILGANNFEEALEFYPRAAVDPDRTFRLRDLLALYLAHLLAVVDAAATRAFGRDGGLMAMSRVRFTRPGWIPERIAAAHEAMARLFNQAHFIYQSLGEALLAPEGVSYDMAQAALAAARANAHAFANLDGGIYEASAVAVCHYSEPNAPNCLLIVDIGAGTTDIAGLMRSPLHEGVRVVRAARRTIDIAGDDFDAALVELLMSKSGLRSTKDRSALWRSVIPVVRDLKEELFATGVVNIEFRKQRISCTSRELERQSGFRDAYVDIEKLYRACLRELADAARRERAHSIGIVLAGGGSQLPAIHAMVKASPWLGFGVRLKLLPSVPSWANELNASQDFSSLFVQLSAAFGAAISQPEHANAREGVAAR